jgi:hypothetical protein
MRFSRTMAFLRVSGLACIALFFAALHGGAQGPHSDTAKAFNGSSLAGWRPQGSAQWRVANGEILGSATTGPGVLVLDRTYQDFVLTFAFQCECDAGVLLRNAPAPAKPETTISVGDVNRDGKMDALSGPYAHLGPEFERAFEIYPPQTYSIAGPRQAGLYTDNFLPNRVIGLAKPGTDATKRWTFVPISEKGDWGGHGYGYGDGKADIVQGSGWSEQPASGANGTPWPFHAGPFGRGADPFVRGADIFVYDVNGEKLPDIITSLFAHGPGLAWYEQQRTGQGPITWKMHMVMDRPTASPEERRSRRRT